MKNYDSNVNKIIEDIITIIQVLSRHNVNVPCSSRLYEYKREMEKLLQCKSFEEVKNIDVFKIAQGIREVNDLRYISQSSILNQYRPNELSNLIKGHYSPDLDKNKLSRNWQFQIYLTSIFKLAGLCPFVEEPDLSFIFNDQKYNIAVKRIYSSKKVKDNLNGAVEQIEKHEQYGFIAVSIDHLVLENNDQPYIVGNDPSKIIDVTNEICQKTVKKHYFDFASITSEKVVGFIISLTLPVFLQNKIEFGGGSCLHVFGNVNFDNDELRKIRQGMGDALEKDKS